MFLIVVLSMLHLIKAELICGIEGNPALTYECSSDHYECCDEGCCVKAFVIPKVSISLCVIVLLICLFYWCVHVFSQLFGGSRLVTRTGALKPSTSTSASVGCDYQAPPPSYSVAINFPTMPALWRNNEIPTYEDAVSKITK